MPEFFQQMIAPTTVNNFLDAYYEKDMLYIERDDQQYYSNVLTAKEISNFLDRQDIFYPSLRIVKSGKEVPSSQYTYKSVPIGHHRKEGVINTHKIFTLFNEGSTLVIQAGQRYFDNLSKCCQRLSQKFSAPVQANLYITPNKSQGFNPHWDTHDVFVLQIAGTKTWKLYGFEKELPVKNQTFVSKNYAKEPIQVLQLKPGDFLYLPRGYVHDAIADDGISAHITIGVLSYTWSRLFNEVFTQLDQFKSFREAVPFWNGDIEEIIQQKKELLKQKIDELDINKSIQNLTDNYHRTQPQPVNNFFGSLLNKDKVSGNTRYALNEHIIFEIIKNEEAIDIKFFEKRITLPAMYTPLIEWIFDHKEFSQMELPGELGKIKDDRIKKLLLNLVAEGMLFIKTL